MVFTSHLALPTCDTDALARLLVDVFDGEVIDKSAVETQVDVGGYTLYLEHRDHMDTTVWFSMDCDDSAPYRENLAAHGATISPATGPQHGYLCNTPYGVGFFLADNAHE